MNPYPQHPANPPETHLPEFERSAPPSSPVPPRKVPVKLPATPPYVTYTLLGITVLVYLLQVGAEYLIGFDLPAYYGLKVNALIARGELWRLFTPMLLHGSITHIAFNMYALHLFGPGLERYFGHWRLLALYVISGFGGNVASMMFTEAPSLGSSTAIFGLLGAQGVFMYQNRDIFEGVARRALGNIISVALINLVIGLSPGIDNWGHIGGLIGGTAFTWLGGPILKVTGIYPALSLSDQRESSAIIQAFVVVGAFFGVLAAGAVYLMNS